jgi:hypothetical protein
MEQDNFMRSVLRLEFHKVKRRMTFAGVLFAVDVLVWIVADFLSSDPLSPPFAFVLLVVAFLSLVVVAGLGVHLRLIGKSLRLLDD